MIPTPERSVRQWEREAQESALRSLERRARRSGDQARRAMVLGVIAILCAIVGVALVAWSLA